MAGKKIQQLYCWKIKTGELIIYLASSLRGAVSIGISITDDRDCIEYFLGRFPYAEVNADKGKNSGLACAVRNALEGKPYLDDLSIDIAFTPFQQKVLYKIAEIPFGSVRTYGDIAKLIDRPGCARAVGQVMHRNPLPVIFPCHRVVASNGLGGFNGGLKLKRFLLEKEGNFTF